MSLIPRACGICGKPTTNGSRCEKHDKQAFRAPTSCVVCGTRSPFSYCDKHRYGGEPDEMRARQTWRAGYDADFARNSKQIRKEANGRCQQCGRDDLPLEIDHRISLSSGLKRGLSLGFLNSKKNLVALCIKCHGDKTRGRDKRRKV